MRSPLVVLASLLLAGCVSPAALESASSAPRLALVSFAESEAAPAILRNGSEIAASEGAVGSFYVCFVVACTRELTCEPGSCERVRFQVDAPATVHVRAQSARNYTVGPALRIYDAAGDLVAEGKLTDWLSVATLDGASGDYEAEVIAAYGAGAYQLAVVVAQPATPAQGPPRELLPDLVTIKPSDLRIQVPDQWGVPALGGGLAPGCAGDETIEGAARRCLRFSNGVANVGEGPLEVRLAREDAALGLAGEGRFVQRIGSTDGSAREVEVGNAAFHAAHAHYHYAGLATYELYEYDEGTGTRGELVREGRKAGFCFYDTAMLDLLRPDVGPQAYDGRGCLDPAASLSGDSWYTGVSPGFTDFYGWYLSDQYVEITGVPDGTYELVSVADGYGTLVESDATNNAASAVFRLRGNDVEVLSTTGA